MPWDGSTISSLYNLPKSLLLLLPLFSCLWNESNSICHLGTDGRVCNDFGAQSIFHYKLSMFFYCCFRKEIQIICLNTKEVQSLGVCPQIAIFLLKNKIKVRCDFNLSFPLMGKLAIQFLDAPKAWCELCSAIPRTPRFRLSALARYQLIHHSRL